MKIQPPNGFPPAPPIPQYVRRAWELRRMQEEAAHNEALASAEQRLRTSQAALSDVRKTP